MAAAAAQVAVLGRLSAGGPVTGGPSLPGRRAELVFAYLAVEHHRAVTRDELADALWPSVLPPSWSAALRGVVSEVRRFLHESGWDAEHILATVRSGYQLRLPAEVATDLDVVRTSLEVAIGALATAQAAVAVAAASTAASLAGLPFLADHDGEWVERTRRELRRARGRALRLEAEARSALGDAAGGIEAATTLVEWEPLDETAHQLRIRLLAEAGDRAQAARAYQECRAVLAAELGVEPAADTAAAAAAAPRVATRRRGAATAGDETESPLTAASGSAPPPAGFTGVRPPTAGLGRVEQLGVLVVEDHDFQRRTLLQVLKSLPVAWADSAGNGAEALERLSRLPTPDVILCDLDMPGMDGVELVRHLSARDPGAAVVITSGLEASVIRAVESLGAGYGLKVLGALAKPVTARSLREVLSAFFTPCCGPNPVEVVAGPGEAADLRHALASGGVTARFHPRLDLASGELGALVAAPWWARPGARAISPPVWDAGEVDAGSATALTDHLLELSVSLLATGSLSPEVAVIVGLARTCLTDLALADRWAGTTLAHGVPAPRVAAALDAGDHPAGAVVLDAMTRLRLKGFGLVLHDFDGGSAALDHAARLPLTGITLASRLVSGAGRDPDRRHRLERAFEAASSLGVPVGADGCDSQGDFALALALGCRQVQGAVVGPALPADRLSEATTRWPVPAPAPAPGPASAPSRS